MLNKSLSTLLSRATAAALLVLMVGPAWSYVVSGRANPNLAGRDASYTCCTGDGVATEAPLLVTGFAFSAGNNLQFTVSGRTAFGPGAGSDNNADGDYGYDMTNYGDGISAPKRVRVNALVGLFLSDDSPTGGPTPAQLDFAYLLDFASLAPGLGQIFYIGDGLTSYAGSAGPAGVRQDFTVPKGATRLFLATSHGFGWFNNSGSFNVEIGPDDAVPVPTPGSMSLVLAALGILAVGRLSRR